MAFLDTITAAADVLRPSAHAILPLDKWIQGAVREWLVPVMRPTFRAMQWPVAKVMDGLEAVLLGVPFIVLVALAAWVAWRAKGFWLTGFTVGSLLFLDWLGLWAATMITFAMILTAVAFCLIIGIPLGILSARSDFWERSLRPLLDIMQTIPSFVYLVPIVMLFGVGMVPAVIATIIFALPPLVRLTNLGIRQVNRELIEAGQAFGSTPRQILWEIQLPLALRTIMTGVNQTLMLALSMAVITAMIGGQGLGSTVLYGISRVAPGIGLEGGLGIVVLAIVLDRISSTWAARRKRTQS